MAKITEKSHNVQFNLVIEERFIKEHYRGPYKYSIPISFYSDKPGHVEILKYSQFVSTADAYIWDGELFNFIADGAEQYSHKYWEDEKARAGVRPAIDHDHHLQSLQNNNHA